MTHTTSSPQTRAAPLQVDLSERLALGPKHLLVTLWFCAFFMYCNYIPIYHSDIWGHVAYGDWILQNGGLPKEDPFVPLAEGVPIKATAWLGQVVFAAAEGRLGPEWISNIFAITFLASYLVLARVFYLQTGRAGLAGAGAVLVWIVGWSRHAIVRPEIFGSLCFALLFWLVVRAGRFSRGAPQRPGESLADRDGGPSGWALWLGVPVIFAAWANLHGSFVVGFAVLGCQLLGRAVEVLWQSQSVTALLGDRAFRRWLLLSELAVAGTLVNPYGIDLLIHAFLFPANPNLDDVIEWFPLEMVSYEGIEIGFSWILALVVLRHSRAKMRPAGVLLLAVLTLSVCIHVRMVTWYAPAVIVILMPHLADVTGRLFRAFGETWGPIFSGEWAAASIRYTLVACLLAWIAFAFAPVSRFALGGKPRPAEHLYGHETPRSVTEYFRNNPPEGQIANPQWWGDWLVWDGPPGLQVFMTTNAVHAAPPRVWSDYLAIARGLPGLERRLDRYRVNTVVVHKDHQKRLTRTMRRLEGWSIGFEDDLALVAVRGNAAASSNSDNELPAAARTDGSPAARGERTL